MNDAGGESPSALDARVGAVARRLFETGRASLPELAVLLGRSSEDITRQAVEAGWTMPAEKGVLSHGEQAAALRRASARLGELLEALIEQAADSGEAGGSQMARQLVDLSKGILGLEEIAGKMDMAEDARNRNQPGARPGTGETSADIVAFRQKLERQIAALGQEEPPA